MPAQTAAGAVIRALADAGVRHVFGIPGVTTLEFFRALAEETRITFVGVGHEQGAAFMADGYARATGGVGVLCVVNGPGVTNALTGVAEAYADSSALLLLTTESERRSIGRETGLIHELRDQIGLASQVCKAAIRIDDAERAYDETRRALALAAAGRRRPVYLDVPADVLTQPLPESASLSLAANMAAAAPMPPVQAHILERAAALLERARQPVVYVGGGMATDAGRAALRRFAERVGAPVITTVKGKSAFPAEHALAVGASSFAVEIIESELLRDADLLVAVGTRLSARLQSGAYGRFRFPDQLIHIDVDADVIGRTIAPTLGIQAEAAATLDALCELVPPSAERVAFGERRAQVCRATVSAALTSRAPIIARFLDDVRAALPADAIVVGDNALVGMWAARYLPIWEPGQFLFPMGFATLGFGVPAAIGARLGRPDRPVLALVGDGSFRYSADELAVACESAVDLSVVLVNDHRWGSVHFNQRKRGHPIFGTERRGPDFARLVGAYGAYYRHIADPTGIRNGLAEALGRRGVNVIEVDGDFLDWY